MDSGPLYLGLDLSTQQLKAIIVSSDLRVVSEAKVDFDADFGDKYGVKKGVLVNGAENEVFAPVAMWLGSLDLVLGRLRDKEAPLGRVRGVSGACQQHGSVFWGAAAEARLAALEPGRPLVEQLADALAHPFAPNWQDGSTQSQCDEFDAALGGNGRLADVTGSAAHHRFTGPQIMRMRQKRPEVYDKTARISLVSSFLASLFLGKIAPMDISDACGMNLWDMAGGDWSAPLLDLAAGGAGAASDALRARLGEVRRDGGGSMGAVHPYFAGRYGLGADCQVVPFTGDNPATILALPLRPGDAIVSLGTSTTFLMVTPRYVPHPHYHFFNHPCTPGQYMFMLCYKNGGLARERVRDALPAAAATADKASPWVAFNKAVLDTPPLGVPEGDQTKEARLGLYFYLPEIVPNVRAGTWRYACNPTDGSALREVSASADPGAASTDPSWWGRAEDARAIVESQALSLRLRSRSLVDAPSSPLPLPAQPRRVYLVGGGSGNAAIARVVGDVLGGAEGVYRLDVGGNACALGGAYKAVWALERRDEAETFDELIGARWREDEATSKIGQGYREGVFERYGAVLGAFERMEREVLAEEGR
ncbi:hypothetical protein RB597_007992 [Gaeumannomyces tritici]